MRAIVFDFFGTLTDPGAEAGRRASFTATAAALGVPAEQFWREMAASFPERIVGRLGGTRATLRAIARRCGIEPAEERLDAAVAVQLAGAELVRPPRAGVLDLLDRLRADGFRIGLISDCSSELYESWPMTPYAPRIDAAVFSWHERCRKPDSRLYVAVSARLGVSPADCWYVGDGGSREHDGARRAGMRPVLVSNAGYPGVHDYRTDPDPYRPDLVIADLDELPTLIGS
ncbi:HAD family hydrolase [Actinoplanes sp. KI2]|uniref:HAD family hydrolase n=1 Tax=Actinoplanes sp. KI2 TaxID=2983315 RepID=UPI0021D5A2B0|nr:HAD family hydrolase [Actinoplanes sp. KI2]MCU7726737.1 HAD family hydrolase [Actinoplanes sp. KI2]